MTAICGTPRFRSSDERLLSLSAALSVVRMAEALDPAADDAGDVSRGHRGDVWRSIRFDLGVRHGLRRWRQPAALRADDLRRPQPLPAASSARWRAKRLTAVTSVAASRSSLPI